MGDEIAKENDDKFYDEVLAQTGVPDSRFQIDSYFLRPATLSSENQLLHYPCQCSLCRYRCRGRMDWNSVAKTISNKESSGAKVGIVYIFHDAKWHVKQWSFFMVLGSFRINSFTVSQKSP